ncbi:MAG: FkbM family methyltransferase [Pseudomonadota bacterium]
MTPIDTLRFIRAHPLSGRRPLDGVARYFGWQLRSRLSDEVETRWVDGLRLVARRGMTGATGNIYCGLHEPRDMALTLHLLRPGDLFVDAGANIGAYTLLAAGAAGAQTLSVEPDPQALAALRRNIAANGLEARVEIHETALGSAAGVVRFSDGRDTVNRVLTDAETESESESETQWREASMATLDELLAGRAPTMIKLDLEGHERQALAGAEATLTQETLLALVIETVDPAARSLLARHGFEEAFYDPLSRVVEPLQGGERGAHGPNHLFLRNIEAARARVADAPVRNVYGLSI